ncbi:MAG: hypothetical protein HY297_04790 [Thaumarchaeota archaeon]|nr:hypothetical protein [Nitrososphaerota archaeon]
MVLRSSRRLSLVAIFAALAVVLNRISVPDPFATYLLFGLWEIPVVLALLVLGFWGGVSVASVNALALEALNPGTLPTGPLYNLIAEASMLVGVVGFQAVARKFGQSTAVLAAGATLVGGALRTGVMSVVNFLALPQSPPIGFNIPYNALPGYLVAIAVFNFAVALYTVPLAFSIREAVAVRYPAFNPGAWAA